MDNAVISVVLDVFIMLSKQIHWFNFGANSICQGLCRQVWLSSISNLFTTEFNL